MPRLARSGCQWRCSTCRGRQGSFSELAGHSTGFDTQGVRAFAATVAHAIPFARRTAVPPSCSRGPASTGHRLPWILRPEGDSRNDLNSLIKTKLFFSRRLPPKRRWNRGRTATWEFERKRALYGAITPAINATLPANYFTFIGTRQTTADVVMRLEYRQQTLGR